MEQKKSAQFLKKVGAFVMIGVGIALGGNSAGRYVPLIAGFICLGIGFALIFTE